jgi:hypothetical protein
MAILMLRYFAGAKFNFGSTLNGTIITMSNFAFFS